MQPLGKGAEKEKGAEHLVEGSAAALMISNIMVPLLANLGIPLKEPQVFF